MILVGVLSLMLSSPAQAGDATSGKAVYTANCMACHGVNGDGNGPAAMALDPRPRDFSDPAFWVGREDDAKLAATVKSGRPGTAMAPFPQLNDADMANLIAYLRTFEKKPQ